MLRRIGLAALSVSLTLGLLIVVLGLAPNAALFASASAQPTVGVSDAEPLPLTFFLARPTPDFAAILVSLNLTDQQANGWAMVVKDEGQMLGEAQRRGTLAQDVGPIGASSWQRLKDDVLTADQYAKLRDWAVSNRDLAMPALRAALDGGAATPMASAATGVAAAATSVANGNGKAATPVATAAVPSGPISAAASAATAVQAATPAAAIVAAATSQPAATSIAATTPAATPTASSLATTGTVSAPAAAIGTPTPAPAKPAGGTMPGSITVIGSGRAAATPDVARVTLGVNTTADTVKAATSDANTRLAAVVAKLKSLGVADKDIQTTQYNVYPQTQEDRPTPLPAGAPAATPKPPKIVYHVSAAVTVTLRDLSSVGPIIDAAVDAGANTVGGISFTVDNPAPVMDQARANAVASAKAQAQQLAQLTGVTLGPPTQITEVIGSPAPQPVARAAAAAGALAAPPPIEAGEMTYTSQIQITYAFNQ